MEESIQEKETTLKLMDKHLDLLSRLYKECYLQKGRGALILYPFHVENIPQLSCIDYNNRNQSLDLFDNNLVVARNLRKSLQNTIIQEFNRIKCSQ